MAKRRRFSAPFQAKVALEALRGDRTIQEIAAKHQIHPNQVWCADITFVPVCHGFLYMMAIMDWATRKVLA